MIADNEHQLEQIRGFKSTLYENMVTGIISKDDFKALKSKYVADELMLQDALSTLNQKLHDALAGDGERMRWADRFKRFAGITAIDRRTIVNLIQNIRVVSKTELVITFNYQAEYETVLSLLPREVA